MTIVRFILGLAACCLAGQSQAQWTSDAWTFTDPARDDRPIPMNFLRPDGDPEPLPWVIVAHGFVMGPDDYDDLATALVEQGFLVGLVDTETGFAPSHEDYAKDLVYLAEQGAQALADADAPLAAWIQGNVGLVGHSMGGGAAWLAASMATVSAVVGLAPAETNPSAIAAGGQITAPSLVISGSADAVTPPSSNHLPIHESVTSSPCKAWVNLIEGGHCGFADEGTLCDLGELLFSGMPRDVQQQHAFTLVGYWLQFHMGLDPAGLDAMDAYGVDHNDVEVDLACVVSFTSEASQASLACFPVPASSLLTLQSPHPNATWQAWDLQGRAMALRWVAEGQLDIQAWPVGAYVIQATSPSGASLGATRILVAR